MGLVILLVINVLYAGTPTFMKIASVDADPATVVLLRHTLGLVTILPFFMAKRKCLPLRWSEIGRLAIATLLSFTVASLLQVESMRRSSASAGAIIVAMEPVAMVALAMFFLHERFQRVQLYAFGAAVVGFFVLSAGGGGLLAGNFLYLVAVICDGSFAVLMKPMIAKHSPRQLAFWCLLFASSYLLPFQWHSLPSSIAAIRTQSWLAILYLGIGCSALAMLLWLVSLQRFKVSTVAVSWFLQPVCGAVIAVLLLGEPISANFVFGGVLILVAVAILLRVESARPVRVAVLPARLNGHRHGVSLYPSPAHYSPNHNYNDVHAKHIMHRHAFPSVRHHPPRRKMEGTA